MTFLPDRGSSAENSSQKYMSMEFNYFRVVTLVMLKTMPLNSSDQKIVGNSFQPVGDLITGNCINQGFRRKVLQWTSLARSATYDFLEFSDMIQSELKNFRKPQMPDTA